MTATVASRRLECGDCVHWQKQPANPHALDAVVGQCRQAPPQAVVQPRGVLFFYPLLPADFPACDQYAPAVRLAQE